MPPPKGLRSAANLKKDSGYTFTTLPSRRENTIVERANSDLSVPRNGLHNQTMPRENKTWPK